MKRTRKKKKNVYWWRGVGVKAQKPIWLKFIYLDFELSWVWVKRINSFLKLWCTWVRGNLARFVSQAEGWFNLIEFSLWLNSDYVKELSKQYCFVNESQTQATNLSHELKPNQGKPFFIRAEFELPLILIHWTRANSFFFQVKFESWGIRIRLSLYPPLVGVASSWWGA